MIPGFSYFQSDILRSAVWGLILKRSRIHALHDQGATLGEEASIFFYVYIGF